MKKDDKKVFRSMKEVREYYFPKSEEEQEKEFLKAATPKEIGEHLAKQHIEKLRTEMEKIYEVHYR